MKQIFYSILFFFLSCGGASAQIFFGPPTQYTSGQMPAAVAVADFNKDGRPDVAMGNLSGYISIFLTNASGNLSAKTDYTAALNIRNMDCADFDQDGNIDIVAVNYAPQMLSSSILILFGDGTGGFSAPLVKGTISCMKTVIAKDVNGDGYPDIINGEDNTPAIIRVWLNDTFGTFSGSSIFSNLPARPDDITSGDFNGDGVADFALSSNVNNQIFVCLSDGAGSFSSITAFATGQNPWGIASGDFNEDGKMDIATTNGVGNMVNNVSILPGDGSGSFPSKTNFTVETVGAMYMIAADFDLDGHLDIVTNGNNLNRMEVLKGDGTGSFGPATFFVCGSSPDRFAKGDFDLDGKPDLVIVKETVNTSSNTFWIMQNGSAVTALEEFNNNLDAGVIPNPNNGNFVVKTDINGNFKVVNSLGQTAYEFYAEAGAEKEVNLNGLSAGIYFLIDQTNRNAKKIIITNH